MKIAVPSLDGSQVSPHFGRSAHFLVFDIEDGKVAGKEVRPNPFACHSGGGCHGEGHHGDEEAGHGSMAATLRDCSAVLCYGMGAGAAGALNQAGVRTYQLGKPCTAEDAVALFLEGKLLHLADGPCQCHR